MDWRPTKKERLSRRDLLGCEIPAKADLMKEFSCR
jgi:hypothetical protein